MELVFRNLLEMQGYEYFIYYTFLPSILHLKIFVYLFIVLYFTRNT